MKKIILIIFIIYLICLLSCEQKSNTKKQPVAEKGILDLRDWDLKNGNPVELRGEWEFYWEQFLFEKDFEDTKFIKNTKYFQLPGIWNDYEIDGKKISGNGYGTFRLRLLVNESFEKIVLKVLSIQTASRIYINGKLVCSAGIPGVEKRSSEPGYKPQILIYEPETDYVDIVIHVSNFDHRQGGIWGTLNIGSEKDMAYLWRYSRDRDFFFIGAIIIMGIYYLGLYLIHKQEREAIFFSLYCFVIALRLMVTGDIFLLNIFPGLPWKALISLEYLTFFMAIPLFLMFIYSLFTDKILKIFIIIMLIISSIFSLITLMTPVSISSWLIPAFQLATLTAGLYIVFILVKNSLRKNKQAIIILVGFITMFVTVINDILYAADVINTAYTISYGILLFIIFQSTVMTIRFAHSFIEVERQQKLLKKTINEYRHELEERIRLEEDLHISYQSNAKTKLAIIMGLAKLAEYRDSDTGSHIERIQEFNAVLAKQLQKHSTYAGYISDEYIEDLHISSILHDIGKVGIPDSILQKPGKLTEAEFEIMKEHAVIGGDSISTVEQKTGVRSFLTLARDIAYMHHERWDGTGYPGGIKGESIPLSARLTALVDVYDALTSRRCYKRAFSHEEARAIIIESRGAHFDPDIVDAFIEIDDVFDQIRKSLQDNLISDPY